MYEVDYNDRTYVICELAMHCHIRPEVLLCVAESDLFAIAEFVLKQYIIAIPVQQTWRHTFDISQ